MARAASLAVDSAGHWRAVRRDLNQRRHALTQAASHLYPSAGRVGATGLLCRQEWIPDRPLDLNEVQLTWAGHAPPPAVTGGEPASAGVRPERRDGERYPAYADAIAALDPPALFENRPSYRLLSARFTPGPGQLELTSGCYFDGVNIGEALAHELAAATPDRMEPAAPPGLPLRELVGDPCDLSRRSAIPAITTLTLRRAAPGQASFLLHWRDPAKVTHAGGMHQVIPVGIFQPADRNPASAANDLSLWRSMVREYSEELLGTAEDYPDLGSPLDYHRWPFYRELSAARQAGKLTVWCLGVGVDPLTLATDVLCAAVFDSDVFDSVFRRLVAVNAEGRVISGPTAIGLPFTEKVSQQFASGGQPMQPAGAAVLQQAWQHHALLLR